MYVALMKNATVLVNTTNAAQIELNEQGNYTCVATSKYGTDLKEFPVTFNSKSYTLYNVFIYMRLFSQTLSELSFTV